MNLLNDTVRKTRPFGFVAALLLGGAACVDPTGRAMAPYPTAGPLLSMGAREVTIDFSTFGAGKVLDPDFYRSDGIVFPPEFCGTAGCDAPFVGFIQFDAALVGDPRRGPLHASFTRPISGLSLSVAPSFQGTATYVLKVFSASGALLTTTSRTVTQDEGDPANEGFGYFTISATDFERPAKSFTLDNVFVRASGPFPHVGVIPYAVSSITYTRGQQP